MFGRPGTCAGYENTRATRAVANSIRHPLLPLWVVQSQLSRAGRHAPHRRGDLRRDAVVGVGPLARSGVGDVSLVRDGLDACDRCADVGLPGVGAGRRALKVQRLAAVRRGGGLAGSGAGAITVESKMSPSTQRMLS